jgi:hypothetical protein
MGTNTGLASLQFQSITFSLVVCTLKSLVKLKSVAKCLRPDQSNFQLKIMDQTIMFNRWKNFEE